MFEQNPIAAAIHDQVSQICPIFSVRETEDGYEIEYKDEATEDQRLEAERIKSQVIGNNNG